MAETDRDKAVEEAALGVVKALFKLNWLNQALIDKVTKAGESVLEVVPAKLRAFDLFGPQEPKLEPGKLNPCDKDNCAECDENK